jgi:Sortase domain
MRRRYAVALALGGIGVVATTTGVTLALRGHSAPAVARHAQVHVPEAGVVATPTPTPVPTSTATPTPLQRWVAGQSLARTLQDIDLHAAYGDVPMRFAAPTVGIDTSMIGVGLTKTNNVDAPEGPRTSPLWDQAFWYRGGAEPGQPGVFAVAGHVDRVGGAPAAFWRLRDVKVGDVVEVTDQRNGAVYRYRISEAQSYTVKQAEAPAVLDRIYGHDVSQGYYPPSVPADLVPRISIITCTGSWTGVMYDHRFIVFGELVTTP